VIISITANGAVEAKRARIAINWARRAYTFVKIKARITIIATVVIGTAITIILALA
jgi:hypothetical protein